MKFSRLRATERCPWRSLLLAYFTLIAGMLSPGRLSAYSYIETPGDATIYLSDDFSQLGYYSLADPYGSLSAMWADQDLEDVVNELWDIYGNVVHFTYYASVDPVSGALAYDFYADNYYCGTESGTTCTFYTDPYWDGYVEEIYAWAALPDPVLYWDLDGADYIGDSGDISVYATNTDSTGVTITLELDPPEGAEIEWSGAGTGTGVTRQISTATANSAQEASVSINGSDYGTFRILVYPAPPSGASSTSDVDLDMTPVRDNSIVPSGFFGNVSQPQAVDPKFDVYYEGGKFKFVFTKMEYNARWGVSSTGAFGETDLDGVANNANPFPVGLNMSQGSLSGPQWQAAKLLQAKNDLTPPGSDPKSPPRTKYWISSLTEAHEKFHYDDLRDNFLLAKMLEAEAAIEGSSHWVDVTTSSTASSATSALASKESTFESTMGTKIVQATTAYDPAGGAEDRAHGAVATDYHAYADPM